MEKTHRDFIKNNPEASPEAKELHEKLAEKYEGYAQLLKKGPPSVFDSPSERIN
ncbi:MAG: hypothetical protein Q7U36_02825 [bacterium]|nr:hypothetical protein [bacterium]